MKSKTASFAVDSLIVLAIVAVFIWFRFAREERYANAIKSTSNAKGIWECLGGFGGFGFGGHGVSIDSSKWTDTALKEAGSSAIFVSPQIMGYKDAPEKTCHYALNVGRETSKTGLIIFECDLGWNGVGGQEDALSYMKKHNLSKIAVAFSDGSARAVSATELIALDWGSPPKPKPTRTAPTPTEKTGTANVENNSSGNNTAP